MALNLIRWLEHLPRAEEEVAQDLVLDGWLIQDLAGSVHIVTGGLCLTFGVADVLSIDTLGAASAPGAQRARIVVRRGSPLIDVRPQECMASYLPASRRPFAMSSRPLFAPAASRARYRDKEADFIRRSGLSPSDV